MTFEELGLKSEVLKSLKNLGFETPTPIQQKAIPYLLGDISDFVGLAQTGTGKTAAFGLPLISKIKNESKNPEGLVICPTRELCLQISKDLENFGKYTDTRITAVYGGANIKEQINAIKRGTSIIVATPGRLVDLINRKAVKLSEIEYVVLDEADEMLNMGFKEELDTILDATPDWKNVWLFSATMPKEVLRIAKTYMENPMEVSVGERNHTNKNIDHIYYVVKESDRFSALKRLIDFHPDIYGLVFCRTRRETAQVAEKLAKEGYNAEPLHGDLSQAQRDRVMNLFRKRNLQILVATDVAARGIDVDDITHVINYNLPDDVENYTHRSGRTARAGKKGESLVLINGREGYKIKAIEKVIGTEFKKGVIPGPQEICEVQLIKLIDNVIETKVKEEDIEEFMPMIQDQFEALSKEEVIKKFVSAEFNRFLDYYERAGDLNVKLGKDKKDGGGKKQRSRNDENKVRFFASLGKRDGLNTGGLVRTICDSSGLKSDSIGRVDVMSTFSFFEVDKSLEALILDQVNGAEYEGKYMKVEVTKKESSKGNKRSGGGRGRDRNRGRDNRRSDKSNKRSRRR